MLNWIMNKIGFISLNEAEKYDSTLMYQLDGKTHNEKIVECFNDDGHTFISRKKGVFSIAKSAKNITILDYRGEVIYTIEDDGLKKKYINRLEEMSFLFANIVEDRKKLEDNLFKDTVQKFKTATLFVPIRKLENIDIAIEFMKNDIWIDLYGKKYDDFMVEIYGEQYEDKGNFENKKRQIPGGFTEEEIARMELVISSNEEITSKTHFMRIAGLKLLQDLEWIKFDT